MARGLWGFQGRILGVGESIGEVSAIMGRKKWFSKCFYEESKQRKKQLSGSMDGKDTILFHAQGGRGSFSNHALHTIKVGQSENNNLLFQSLAQYVVCV